MTFSVCFIERREGGSPSIERVFRAVADELNKRSIETSFVKVAYGNGILGIFFNLLLFRPPQADIFHIIGHVNYLGLTVPKSNSVSTIHDLTILDLRSGLRRWLIEKLFFVWPSRRLEYLTVISPATKERLIESSGISPEKVRVIENPLLVSSSQKSAFRDTDPIILQVGTAPNKNVERLVEALAGIPCRLHIVGRISDSLRQRIQDIKISLINDESLDDVRIEEAYRNADIVTLCSTNEGFGLPIIEGQANGTLVITSDRSPMKEVAGGGAILVDPESVDSIRDGISAGIRNSQLRDTTIEIGRRNVLRFEKSEVARQYLSLYNQILQEIELKRSK
jgi:glycosyltransferase involved in cell wall biosynthesis